MAPHEAAHLRFSTHSHAFYSVPLPDGRDVEISVQRPRQMTEEAAQTLLTDIIGPLAEECRALADGDAGGPPSTIAPGVNVLLPGWYRTNTPSGAFGRAELGKTALHFRNCPGANGAITQLHDTLRTLLRACLDRLPWGEPDPESSLMRFPVLPSRQEDTI